MDKKVLAKKTLSVVTGYHWVTRTKETLVKTFRNVQKTAGEVADSVDDRKAESQRGDAKFSVYSHSQGRFFYADDFGEAMSKAYTKDEIARMERESRMMRRLHAHGATAVFVLSIVATFWFVSLIPLFSIAPASTLVAFALRRGCYEETCKQRKLINLTDYLNNPGIFGLWK
jgi:hypothetical protein